MAQQKPTGDPAPQTRKEEERRVDEEIEDSFPASDPPSYSGGGAVGEPRRPKDGKSTP